MQLYFYTLSHFFLQNNTIDQCWDRLDQYGLNPVDYYPYTTDNEFTNNGYTDRNVGDRMPSKSKHRAVIIPLTQAQYDEVKHNKLIKLRKQNTIKSNDLKISWQSLAA